mgnify:CR=1 FL=1
MTENTPGITIKNDRELNDPETTIRARKIIRDNELLRYFYDQNYQFFKDVFTDVPGGLKLELGSGAGYIRDVIPECITSDVLELPFIDRTIDATHLPFRDQEVAGICMIDVFHHIPDVGQFLKEAERVLAPGGKIAMVEPANTRWGRFIYQHFHHEPFDPEAEEWRLPDGGPLSMANGALPWIVFKRDWATITSKRFPQLTLQQIVLCYPLLYLLSGGLSYPQLLPARIAIILDKMLSTGMFYKIIVEKNGAT